MPINRDSILRLSRYKNALYRLLKIGLSKAYSDNIADASGESPARVRKDFSFFGINGNKKGGYHIEMVIARINEILGVNTRQKVIIVGVGKIGAALLEYTGLARENIEIVAGFDIHSSRLNPKGRVPVYSLEKLEDFVVANQVKIAVLAVPASAAQKTFDRCVAAGIKGFMNFAPVPLNAPPQISVSDVNLAAELENLIFFVSSREAAGD